jgi:DNA topoisomerase-2
VCFEVKLLDNFVDKYKKNNELFIKTFNLESSLSITNMVLFDPDGKLKKYTSVEEIMQTFYDLRLKFYQIRKDYMISVIKKDVAILSNKARFIKMIIEDELIIKKKKRNVIVNELYDLKFDTQSTIDKIRLKSKSEEEAEIELINQNLQNEEEKKEDETEKKEKEKGQIKSKVPWKEYDYLLSMNFWNITYEKVEELLKQKELKEKELEELKKTSIETLWINDLDSFVEELDKYEAQEEEDRLVAEKLNRKKGGGGKIEKKKRKRKNAGEKSKINSDKEDNNSESDISVTSNAGKKKGRKKKDDKDDNKEIREKEKEKQSKTKNKRIIIEESDEEKESQITSKNSKLYGKETSISGNDISSNSSGDNKSMFKMPLMERLKKRNVKIDKMSSFKLTSFGKKAKRSGVVDLSDIEFDFNDKDKFF